MSEQSPCRTRTEKAVSWSVGHFGELAAVAAPTVVGAFTTSWLDLASATIAAVWAVHEVRLHRSTAKTRAALVTEAPHQLTTTTSSNSSSAPAGDEAAGRKEAKA
jgi:hypothetical protein